MPLGSPAGPFCASTPLPKLMAARSLPVGARSVSTSGGAAPCAEAPIVAASSMTAAEAKRMIVLPPIFQAVCLGRRSAASRVASRERDWSAARKGIAGHHCGRCDDDAPATPVSAMCPLRFILVTHVAMPRICQTIVRRLHATRHKHPFACAQRMNAIRLPRSHLTPKRTTYPSTKAKRKSETPWMTTDGVVDHGHPDTVLIAHSG
jgi:hypothetical protein